MQNGRIACTLSALLGISFTAQAETLLIDSVKINPAAAPMRGQSIAQVETHYGTPTEKLEPRGGQKRKWPKIDRWVYPNYTVYFEKGKVIDSVMNRVSADEIGPKATPTR